MQEDDEAPHQVEVCDTWKPGEHEAMVQVPSVQAPTPFVTWQTFPTEPLQGDDGQLIGDMRQGERD